MIGHRLDRIHVLGEVNAFFERQRDFLVIQPIGRRVLHALAIRQRDAAPAADQGDEVRFLAGLLRTRAFRANGAAMHQEFVEDALLFGVEHAADTGFTEVAHQRFVAFERLLHLQRVIRHQLRRGVDAGQPAADHHRRQPRLQVR